MESSLTWKNFFKHPRFWRHTILWILFLGYFIIQILVLDKTNPEPVSDKWSPILFMLETILFIYASFYAYHRLLMKKKYWHFAAAIVFLIFIFSFIDSLLSTSILTLGVLKGFWANVLISPMILFVAFGMKLSYNGAKQLFVIQKLKNKQIESELKLLKSQVNPHFLFNTLNNIYSTNLSDHEKANNIILELADLLRYQLQAGKKKFALLSDEISTLESYIELERIRVLDCAICIVKKGAFDTVEILPLLLLPFVENAFKYGTGITPGKIDISLKLDEKNVFTFHCSNKIVKRMEHVHSGGIGLENVKKRLELMYPTSHDLMINEKPDIFIVDLILQL